MCATKEHAGTKMDRVIASMDRLSAALEKVAGRDAAPFDATPVLEAVMENVRRELARDFEIVGPITKKMISRFNLRPHMGVPR